MLFLELDIDKITQLGREKEEENYEFRTFLKGLDPDRVDRIVHRLNDEIAEQIDCKECGNCCKTLRPLVTDSEIQNLSQLDKISAKDFIFNFVEKDDFEDIKYLKQAPCKYLKDKNCSIYNSRPKDCKSYPHTGKEGFISRTLGMIDDYSICPIVFNIYERLKQELDYRY